MALHPTEPQALEVSASTLTTAVAASSPMEPQLRMRTRRLITVILRGQRDRAQTWALGVCSSPPTSALPFCQVHHPPPRLSGPELGAEKGRMGAVTISFDCLAQHHPETQVRPTTSGLHFRAPISPSPSSARSSLGISPGRLWGERFGVSAGENGAGTG